MSVCRLCYSNLLLDLHVACKTFQGVELSFMAEKLSPNASFTHQTIIKPKVGLVPSQHSSRPQGKVSTVEALLGIQALNFHSKLKFLSSLSPEVSRPYKALFRHKAGRNNKRDQFVIKKRKFFLNLI